MSIPCSYDIFTLAKKTQAQIFTGGCERVLYALLFKK